MKIAYDTKLMRPGCAILQSALGGSPEVKTLFPAETWLQAPTPDMNVYEVTPDQLEKLVKMTEERCVKSS